jgi:hypothetical protein
VSRFYFHCSDGVDLILDREGIEVEGSDVLWWALTACGASDERTAELLRMVGLDGRCSVHSLRRCHSRPRPP